MSFFFRASRLRPSPQDLVRSVKESFVALDTKTGAKVHHRTRSSLLPHSSPVPGPICAGSLLSSLVAPIGRAIGMVFFVSVVLTPWIVVTMF
jgi:hypothetical protein